jgi:hypothetical protein
MRKKRRKKHGPRFEAGLPRGGLGFAGFLAPCPALLCAVWANTILAFGVAVACLLVSVWCAIGLRRDDAAGEVTDFYMTKAKGPGLLNILDGDWEPPERPRRISTILIITNLPALMITVILLASR